jgi:hypothetical protein
MILVYIKIFYNIVKILHSFEREKNIKILISLLHPFVAGSKNTMLYFCNRFFKAARQK